ncbi:MAG: AAA family ATPase [bacterium]|nr:AAA family ATPase [bacterium]
MIIGLVGTIGSGKGVCAEYLVQKGFEYCSLSDEIRAELKSRGMPETRELLTEIGNELRAKFGPAILAERVLSRLVPGKNYVVDSIRNPEEVKALRTREDFVLIRIDAPVQLRFNRIQARARPGDVQTFAQFLAQEKAESESPDPNRQQLQATAEMAEFTVINDSTLEELYRQIDTLLEKINNMKRDKPQINADQSQK